MKKSGNSAGAYAFIVPRAQEIARKLGYAIAVHGSMNNDLDLIAAPWVEDPATPEELRAALVKAFSWAIGKEGLKDPGFQREQKPHGRVAWIIPLTAGLSIDLSVMPPAATPPVPSDERVSVEQRVRRVLESKFGASYEHFDVPTRILEALAGHADGSAS